MMDLKFTHTITIVDTIKFKMQEFKLIMGVDGILDMSIF